MKKIAFVVGIIVVLFTISFLGFLDINSTPTELEVHFIDIGQGDSILVRTPSGKNMLIDSGSGKETDALMYYLSKEGIKKFDIVIATHPDEDHIGSMAKIIESYSIDAFYMPEKSHNTDAFIKMVQSLREKQVTVHKPVADTVLPFDENMELFLLNPSDRVYSDNNNYSVVAKLTYKNNSFLFTGDIDSEVEKDLVHSFGEKLNSDVLKLAHHGSASSSSKKFLESVSPTVAIVSAGIDNKYNHPSRDVLMRLKSMNIPVYRTDEQGNIIIFSDGYKIRSNLSTVGSYE